MIEAVLFDLDGTLMDTNYLHVEAWAQAFLAVGRTVPRATIHRQIGKGAPQLLAALLEDPTLHERARRLHGELYAAGIDRAYLLPGAAEMLHVVAAQGIQPWLCTSAQPEELARLLPRLRGADALAGVITSHDVATAKPAVDVFAVALERAGVAPAAALAVGDTVWDVEAASRTGVRCAAVLTGGAYSEAELRAAGAVAVYADCAAALAAGFPHGL